MGGEDGAKGLLVAESPKLRRAPYLSVQTYNGILSTRMHLDLAADGVDTQHRFRALNTTQAAHSCVCGMSFPKSYRSDSWLGVSRFCFAWVIGCMALWLVA